MSHHCKKRGEAKMKSEKKLISIVLILCFLITGFDVQAASENGKNASLIEGQDELTELSIEPQAILHLTQTKWNSNYTVRAGINYSVNDSTNQIIGILSAYIHEYNPAVIKSAHVNGYGFYSGYQGMWVGISYKYHNEGDNDSWHMETLSFY
jgi:hypothetical protein